MLKRVEGACEPVFPVGLTISRSLNVLHKHSFADLLIGDVHCSLIEWPIGHWAILTLNEARQMSASRLAVNAKARKISNEDRTVT